MEESLKTVSEHQPAFVQRDRQCVSAYIHDDYDRNLLPRREIRVAALPVRERIWNARNLRSVHPLWSLVPRAQTGSLSRTSTDRRTDGQSSATVHGRASSSSSPPRRPFLRHLLLPDFAAIFFSLSRTSPSSSFSTTGQHVFVLFQSHFTSTPPAPGISSRPLSSHKAQRTCRRNAKIKSLTCLGW